jgi:hypothetical protein
MNALVENDLFTGYGVGAQVVSVSHLQFVDDILLVEEIYGLNVSFHKSMLFEVNATESWLHETTLVVNWKHGRIPFCIWGCPLMVILECFSFGTIRLNVFVINC